MSLLPTTTSSLLQAARARIHAFQKKVRPGSGVPGSTRQGERAEDSIDHVDLAEASQKLVGNASKQLGLDARSLQQVDTPPLRHIDITA